MTEGTHSSRVALDNSATSRVNQPGREEAVVRAGAHPVEHESPADWGWHGETGKWGQIGGWLATFVVASFFIGNHEGRVEDLWLLAIVGIMALILIWDLRRKKTAWRR